MGTISYAEAFAIIQKKDASGNKVPFSIRFSTHDEKRPNKGSRHVEWEKAEECGANHNLQDHSQVGVRPLNSTASQTAVHIRLIEKINGHTVL